MILKLLENGGSRYVDNVSDCRFSRAPVPHVVYRNGDGGEKRIDLLGDAFVLNAHGDTIDRFQVGR